MAGCSGSDASNNSVTLSQFSTDISDTKEDRLITPDEACQLAKEKIESEYQNVTIGTLKCTGKDDNGANNI